MRIFQFFSFFGLLLLTHLSLGQVTVEYVTNADDIGPGSLREAIASGNDTIVIDVKGVLELESSIPLNHSVVILGPSPKHFSIEMSNLFDAEGLFTFNGFDVELSGVGLKDGVNGVFNINASNNVGNLTVSRCLFKENTLNNSNDNGSTFNINNSGSNVKINACSFFGNESKVPNGVGGAIYLNEGTLEVYNSTFHNNQADKGGAICASNTAVNSHLISIINNTFDGNIANQGTDVYFNHSNVHLRNNIFRSSDDPVYQFNAVFYSSSLNNYTNYPGSSYAGLEYHASLGLRGSSTEDGFGLIYFLFNDPMSPCIDVDANPVINLQLDARRSWRRMYGKAAINLGQYFGSDAVDAGAVEYTPFRVVNASNSGVGSIVDVFDALNNPFVNSNLGQTKRTVVFEISTILNDLDVADLDLLTTTLNVTTNWSTIFNDSLIINGYSQRNSAIAGPGVNANIVTPANIPIQLNGGGGNGSRLIINANNVFVSGLSFVDSKSSGGVRGTGIEVLNSTNNTSIEGCHIGVERNGVNINGNSFGVYADQTVNVGVRKYLKGYPHASRNIITGNDSTQLVLNIEGTVHNNFIGLLGDGTSPGVSFHKGVEVLDAYGSLYIGGNENQSNYFGQLDTAILVPEANIANNYFGFEYDLQTTSNIQMAIQTFLGSGSTGTGVKITNNYFGNILGDAIENILGDSKIQGNTFGLSPKGRALAAIGGAGVRIVGGANSAFFGTVNSQNVLIGKDATNPNSSQGNLFVNCNNAGIEVVLGEFRDPYGGESPPMTSDIPAEIQCVIKGNYIGIDTAAANTNATFGNGVGIKVLDSIYKVHIDSNVIAKNVGAGVAVAPKSKYIRLTQNIMYKNGGLGIDLDANSTANLTEVTKPQANDSLIPPEFLNVIYCDTDASTKIKLKVFIEDYSNMHGIEFYKADVDAQEGFEFKKYETIYPTHNGWNTITLAYPSNVTSNQNIVATLTRFQDSSQREISTSEFSAPFTIGDYAPTFSFFESQYCIGDSAVFKITGFGNYVNNTNGFSSTPINDSTHYFYGTTAGTYVLDVEIDSLGCVKHIDSTYEVNLVPSVNLGNDTVVCQGVSFDLTTIAAGGQWEDTTHTALLSSTVQINHDTAFVYMVANSGCENRDTIYFTANSCGPIANDDISTMALLEDASVGLTINILSNDSVNGQMIAAPTNTAGMPEIDLDLTVTGVQTTYTDVTGNWTYNSSLGEVTYLPAPNFNGTATCNYELIAINNDKDTALITLNVNPVNDAPVILNEYLTTTVDTPINDTTILGNGDNDDLDGGTLSVDTNPVKAPTNGTIVINSDGTFTYTPNAGYLGLDTVVVEICDNGTPTPQICLNDTVFITVQTCDVNDVTQDCDGDGVLNGTEITDGTDYNDACDYISSSVTETPSNTWLNEDCDGDGISNGDELTAASDPLDPCSPNTPSYTAVVDTTLCEGDTINLLTLNNEGDWYDASGSLLNNTTFSVTSSASYIIRIAQNNCTIQDVVALYLAINCNTGNLVTTNAFSPNGGIEENNTFIIDLDYIEQGLPNVVTIYNRWGDVIFKVNNYDNQQNVWDGSNQSGERMPEGTYFYVIEVPEKSFSTSGWVYLNLK
ncbi:MAG: gliding motility-associated C-terminal domain-containing protein [Flavobacteriales bacterium]|jgi:gliding motility-associated-like protein|nr:gliding motility-associated C-terminal domain-containing protein [Flavobacteriales bacterium]